MKRDNLTPDAAVAGVREALLEGWFGRGFEQRDGAFRDDNIDPVLQARMLPDKIDNTAPVQSLQADQAQSLAVEMGWAFPDAADLGRDDPAHDLER